MFLHPNQAGDPLNTQSEKGSNNSTTRQQNLLKERGSIKRSSQDLIGSSEVNLIEFIAMVADWKTEP
jgi:hypothetical protein